MGLFGPYIYKNKNNKKYWLHMSKKGKSTLYYFSKDPRGAVNDLPRAYTVTENPMTGFPFIKKKAGGGLFKKTTDKNVLGENSTETSQKGA
jgi:hypothetical protein